MASTVYVYVTIEGVVPCTLFFQWNVRDVGTTVHKAEPGRAAGARKRIVTQRLLSCQYEKTIYQLSVPHECVNQPCYVMVLRSIIDPMDRVHCDVEVASDVISLFAPNQNRFPILSRTNREEVILTRTSIPTAPMAPTGYLQSPLPMHYNTTLWGQTVMQRNQDAFKDLIADPNQIFFRIDTTKGPVPLIVFSYSAFRDAFLTVPSHETPQDVGDRCEAWFVHLLSITRGLRRMNPNLPLANCTEEEIGNVIGDMVTLPGRCLIYIPDRDRGQGKRVNSRTSFTSPLWSSNNGDSTVASPLDQWIPLSYQPRFGCLGYDCEDHSHFILYLLYALQTRSNWTHPDLQTIYAFLQRYFIAQAMCTIRESGATYGAHVMVVCTDARYVQTMTTQHQPFHGAVGAVAAGGGPIAPLLVFDSTQHSDTVWTADSTSRAAPHARVGYMETPPTPSAPAVVDLRRRILSTWPSDTELPYRVMKSRMTVAEMHHPSMKRYGNVSQLLGVTPNGVVLQVLLGQGTRVGVSLETLASYDDRQTFVMPIIMARLSDHIPRTNLMESAKHIPYGRMPRAPPPLASSFSELYPSANAVPLTANAVRANGRLRIGEAEARVSSTQWLTFCVRGIDYDQYKAEIEACIQSGIHNNPRVLHRHNLKLAIDNDECQAWFIELLCRF